MTTLKTRENDADVTSFLNRISDQTKRNDCFEILHLMKKITGEKPSMWGDSIIGFGHYSYRYANGKEGTWPLTGFSPRKKALTLYLTCCNPLPDDLKRLGKHQRGKSCIYLKKLSDIEITVLEKIIRQSMSQTLSKKNNTEKKNQTEVKRS